MDRTKVIIADHQYLIREGLKTSLKDRADIEVVGETSEADELWTLIPLERPDILMLEINLCEASVRDVMRKIRTEYKTLKVLVISDCDCELPIILSIQAGINGFVRKSISGDELYVAVKSVMQGQRYFSSDITALLATAYLKEERNNPGFSEREMEILRYICKGRSNEQIGDILSISEKTVATHRRNVMKKAGVRKTSDLIIWVHENKIAGIF